MPPKRRRRFQGLYYHSSPPKVLPMNGQINNSNGRRKRDPDDFSVKLSTIRIWMHEKDIGKLTRVLWAGQGTRLRQQASTNPKVKRFLAAVPYVMNSIKDVHQAVIDNNLETLQSHLEPPVPPALVTCRDANGLNLIHKAAGLGHATILEYLITTWPDGVHETDITGKTPLHWAASAKNNMRCYTLLTQAGCDEEAVDYKMKTPSYYRHKPNEIERAFLTYVPEAPRVSPDVSTDWEALSDDSGDGKKLDIKIPEMNGYGRHSNAESNENASEVEGASQEDEDMSKDGDAAENDQEPVDDKLEEEEEPSAEENENEADEKEPEPEPEPEAEPEPEPEPEPDHEHEQEPETTEAASEKEDEQLHEPEDLQENEEDSNKDQTNETEDQNEKQPQQQIENLNDNTENLTKDSPLVAEIEKDGKTSEEDIKESKEMEEEKSDKDNETDKDKPEDIEESKETVEHSQDIEESKETVEHSEDIKETSSSSSTELNDKEMDSSKEKESKEADHKVEVKEDDKEYEDKEKDKATKEMESKEIKEQEKEETTQEIKTEKEGNEIVKENVSELSAVTEGKDMKEQQIEKHEISENQTTKEGDLDKLADADDKKAQEENVISKTEDDIKNDKEHDAEAEKDIKENKANDKEPDKEQDKDRDSEEVKQASPEENIKDDKAVEENINEIGSKVEQEEEENYKTVSEALENIKEEVKDNVKYLANQIQNLFSSDSDSETKEKDHKQQEQENDKEIKEPATQGDTDSNQDETKDKTMENKTEDEKLKEEEIENKNDQTNESSIANNSDKTDQTTEASTSKLNANEIETETSNDQAQSTIEIREIKQNTETPKTPQDQQTSAKAIEETQTAIASDKPPSAKETPSTSDKPPSAKQTPSTSDKPHSAQQKTPKKETEKTEEDENNNNNNSKNNDNITLHKETTDREYQELNQALELYKKEEIEEKEKEKEKEKEQQQQLSIDLGQKLEDMADSVKENVKEMADKVKNIFSSNDDADANDKQETEANDVVVHAVDASKLNGIKTNEKSLESSDDTGDEDEDPEKHTENNEDNNEQENENDEPEEIEAAEENETTEEQPEIETQQKETETEAKADDKPLAEEEKNGEEFVADEDNEAEDSSPTPSLAIEGFVQGDAEDNTVQSQTAAFDHDDDDDKKSRIESIIASGDMEQLAQIVLNGDGQKLLNVEATEPEIQAFLRNVPNYMNKIRRVHEAARGGSLLNLQQALDRRKFAVAKDEISPNGATPLHVAVLFGHSDIVRYLSARFPETTTITDNDGRTPLHYAAVISDNGHFYNVLLQLGANPKLTDKLGHTPEDYLSKEELKDTLNYGQLLKTFNAEELEQQLLNDQGQIENHSVQENPIFKTEQGKYLADNLADPLIKALTQVAQKRPTDPLQYLTNYLQNYTATRNTNGRTITQAAVHTGSSQTNSTILANSKSSTPPVQQQKQQQQLMQRQTMRMNGHVRHDNSENMDDNDAMQRIEEYNDVDGDNDNDSNDSEAEISRKLEERDEHGQSMLHFACARSHRKGGLIHLIEESKADITYRDELYRTARDVALQANQLGNAKEIDRYLMSLAVVGDIKPFEHFAINGYDHIIDVLDDNETPIIDVVASRGQDELAQYLRSIRPLEELREELHQMIRENNVERVKEIVNGPNGRWLIKAKNYYGRTALHIAILKESIEIVEMFVKIAPEALKIGDNLERTPLHYGMGTNIFENISRILIQSGAKRTYKDLKGRQPSYYFMNKADILRLQEEEDENR